MSGAELRDLLQRVKAQGGPLAPWNLSDADDEVEREYELDHFVGVLKRDLIERNCTFHCGYEAIPGGVAWDFTIVTGVYLAKKRAYGDTELEALLRAWLAAAEAESWSS